MLEVKSVRISGLVCNCIQHPYFRLLILTSQFEVSINAQFIILGFIILFGDYLETICSE